MLVIFKVKYFDVVVIIDCIEIKMEIFFVLDNQFVCYLYYKLNIIMKGFVGIILLGVCLFVSDLYIGLIFDKEIII